MRKRLKITTDNDKVYITVLGEVETAPESGIFVWVLAREHIFLRQDLTPVTFEAYRNYIDVYINGLGDFFIDQSEVKNNTIVISEINSVDTVSKTNEEVWELIKTL